MKAGDYIMAIYHCSIKMISRSKGRSSVACSAYRSGEKLVDERTGLIHDFTKKTGVVYSEIMLPNHAPAAYQDRYILWNSVEKIEKSSNAQLAREIEVAFPEELKPAERVQCIQQYVQENFVSQGMCADIAIHDKGDGNPHAHIMLTTRPIEKLGVWGTKEKKKYCVDAHGERIPIIDPATGLQKVDSRNRKQWKRETTQANNWNNRENAEIWRASWAHKCNQYLEPEKKIDHRSYLRQDIEQLPTQHEGYVARQIEKKGQQADRCEINRKIRLKNDSIKTLNKQISYLTQSIKLQEPEKNLQPDFKETVIQNHGLSRKTLEIKEKIAENERKYTDLQHSQTMLEIKQNKILPWTDEMINKALLYYEHAESDIFKEYQLAPRFGKRSKKNLLDRYKNMDYYKIKYALETKAWFEERNIPLPTKPELRQILQYRHEKQVLDQAMKQIKSERQALFKEMKRIEESAEPQNFRDFHKEKIAQRNSLDFQPAHESNFEKNPPAGKKKGRDRSR